MRLAAFALSLLASATLAQPTPVEFDEVQLKRIASLGPWPPARAPDPSNRVSGNPQAIALGERLFDDRLLSKSGGVACTTCHRPAHAFTDGNERAQGIARGDRNTPTVQDLAGLRWYGWDGAQDNLWAQSLRPMLDPREMGADVAHVASRVRNDPALRAAYGTAFGHAPGNDDRRVAVDASKAIAAYLETLTSPRSAFDEFRDALLRGDKEAMAKYPVLAQRGLAIFVGSGKCTTCHAGPRLSNGEFHDVGIPFFAEPGRVDPGRYGGIQKLKASPYNLLGAYNDDPRKRTATSTRHVALDHRNYGEFKVPSLRGVADTAPYMHNGSLATLRDVVRHYSNLDVDRLHADGEAILGPLDLDKYDVDALVAFLETL
ncbi:MAG: cytochrome c peroxidase [Burkholderiales bacterium]